MRKGIFCSMLSVLVAVALLLAFQGCGQQKQSGEKYENSELGFRMEFPASWKDRYTVEANPADNNGTSVVIKTNWDGVLCYVFRYTQEQFAGEGSSPVEHKLLGENDKYAYVMIFPGDVMYDPLNSEQVDTYTEMRNDLDKNVSFEII